MFCMFKARYSPLLVLFFWLPHCFLAACLFASSVLLCQLIVFPPHLSVKILSSKLTVVPWLGISLLVGGGERLPLQHLLNCIYVDSWNLLLLFTLLFLPFHRGEGLSSCVDACVPVERSCLKCVALPIRKAVYSKLTWNRYVVKTHFS